MVMIAMLSVAAAVLAAVVVAADLIRVT